GLSALSYDWSTATAEGTLAPGEQVVATATYTLTQTDVDRGSVYNVATATGTPPPVPVDPTDPDGPTTPSDPLDPVEDDELTPLPPAPSMSLVKDSELEDDAAEGSVITYTFTAANMGNVTLTYVYTTLSRPGLSALSYDWSTATAE